jgi:hypothetical protein
MDDPLIQAFQFAEPGRPIRRIAVSALRVRARLLRLVPGRRTPLRVRDMRRIKTYPDGFVVEEMGTFAPGCPVHRREA